MSDLASPLTLAVDALIAQAHADGDRISLTDVAKALGLDDEEQGRKDDAEEAAASPLADLDDEDEERFKDKLDIAEVLAALSRAGIDVSDEVDETKLEDDLAYLNKQASAASDVGELDAHTLLLKDLGNHRILPPEEETERTTRIALLNRTEKELGRSRDKIVRRLEKAKAELAAKNELLELLASDSEMSAADLAELSAGPKAERDAAAALVASLTTDLGNVEREIEEARALAKAARDEFLGFNYRLVLHTARKIHQQSGHKVDFNDLVLQGVSGMIDALGKFDPTRGYKFSTFATWHIRQKISEFSHEQKGAIRVPTHRHRDIRKIRRFRNDHFGATGDMPSDAEIAAHMGKTVEKIQEIYSAEILAAPGSLDTPLSNESDAGSLGEILPDLRAMSPEDLAIRSALATTLRDAFERVLDGRERRVIQLRFGLYDEARSWTLEEVGQRLGVTRERVRQIEAKALRKLSEDTLVRDLDDKPALPPRPARRHHSPTPPPPRRRTA